MASISRMITREFTASHMNRPSDSTGYGMWGFRNAATGDITWLNGTYTECVKQLDEDAAWIVCP